jgi:hypothetical protein
MPGSRCWSQLREHPEHNGMQIRNLKNGRRVRSLPAVIDPRSQKLMIIGVHQTVQASKGHQQRCPGSYSPGGRRPQLNSALNSTAAHVERDECVPGRG